MTELRSPVCDKRIKGRLWKAGGSARSLSRRADELLLTVKTPAGQLGGCASRASASLPLIYLTDENKTSPMHGSGLLHAAAQAHRQRAHRGHLISQRWSASSALTSSIWMRWEIFAERRLIVEMMGKHSNIIFCDDDGRIIDSIKHVSAQISSVREVLPGREYFIPDTMAQARSADCDRSRDFIQAAAGKRRPHLKGHLYQLYRHQPGHGGGDLLSGRPGIPDCRRQDLSEATCSSICYRQFSYYMEHVQSREHFLPCHRITTARSQRNFPPCP